MRVARPVKLNPEQRTVLEQHSRARSMPARLVERARIVLRAADGLQDQQIADELSITPEKVARWRKRFLDWGGGRFAEGCPPARRATHDYRSADHAGGREDHSGETTKRNALEHADDGCCCGAERSQHPPDLACPWPQAAPGEDIQTQQRSAVYGKTRGDRGTVFEPAGTRHRTLRR